MWTCPSTCRYHAFDNTQKETEDNTQVPELMEKVEEMITDNQGQFLTLNDTQNDPAASILMIIALLTNAPFVS